MKRGNSSDEETTLGERLAVLKEERFERARASFTSEPYTKQTPESAKKRGTKGRPREISSKKAVPMGRTRCLGIETERKAQSVRGGFDPRFEDHCGELREEHFERNFEFVQGLREKKRVELRKEGASRELMRMEQEDLRREQVVRRREVVKRVRKEEKEAVKMGKRPFFMREGMIRELEVKERFKELRANGGVKKFIEKRRKRFASKDRKFLPERRRE